MSNTITFQASVFERSVKYTNFKGETKEVKLQFALHPLSLMEAFARFQPKKSKSANPAKRGDVEMTDADQLKFLRELAVMSAGWASDDGETWEPFEDFDKQLAGQAFLTQFLASDSDRAEFAETVLLTPFRTFVQFAKADAGNSKKEIQQLETYLSQMENVFKTDVNAPDETLEERRERLRRELEALQESNNS